MSAAPSNPSSRERNLLEAWLFGWACMLAVVGVVLLAVYTLLWLTGMPFAGADLIAPGGAFAGAAAFRLYAGLARTP